MPRRIDLTQENASEWGEGCLPEPRYGKNEMLIKEWNELGRATLLSAFFRTQFLTH